MRALSLVLALLFAAGLLVLSGSERRRAAVEPPREGATSAGEERARVGVPLVAAATRAPDGAPPGRRESVAAPEEPGRVTAASALPVRARADLASLALAPRTPAGPQLLLEPLLLLSDVGVRHEGQSTRAGWLTFADLEPGTYRVDYEGADFTVIHPSWIELGPGERREVVVLGHVSETLAVHARSINGRPLATELARMGTSLPLSALATTGPLTLWKEVSAEYAPPFHFSRRVEFLGDRQPRGQRVDELELLQAPAQFFLHLRLGELVIASEPAVPGLGEFSFVLDPERILARLSSLRWRFLRADGEPAGPGEVWFEARPELRYPIGEDGVLELHGLPPGRNALRIQFGDELPVLHSFLTSAGELNEDVVVLGPTTWLSGVAWRGDEPAAGATILLHEIWDERLRFAQRTAADARGRFRFEGVGAGSFALQLTGSSSSDYRRVETHAGAVEGIELRQRAGTRVAFRSQLARALLRIHDGNGLELESLVLGSERVELALVPGIYTLTLTEGGRVVREQQLEVEDTELDLVID